MVTRAEREQEEREQERAKQQQERDKQRQGRDPADQINEDQRRQAEEQSKKQSAYLDEMNRKLADVVESAARMKDQDPQLLNYTVEALKRASQQLEGATPPNVSAQGRPMDRNL